MPSTRFTRAFVRANAVLLALGVAWRAFDGAYHASRIGAGVPPDCLIHYNMLLGWWRNGDSPRGYTLTPSPYFVDIALQAPLALLAPDFEWFAYLLALAFAVLNFACLLVVLRALFGERWLFALGVASASVAVFYAIAPRDLIIHAFTTNHGSETFQTLAVLGVVHALFRPGAPSRRHAAMLYMAVLALCVASDPFFIANYCVPAAAGIVAVAGMDHIDGRRVAGFLVLTVVGALAGLVALSVIEHYVWSVRTDLYDQTALRSYRLFKHTLYIDPRLWDLSRASAVAVIASTVMVIVGRWRRAWTAPTLFMLAFFPACLIACAVLPLLRGVFVGPYELRYMQLPWLLSATFCVALAACFARALVVRLARGRRRPAAPRWLPWTAAALGAGGIALIATARGPLTIFDPASTTAPTLRCLAEADRTGALEDGLSAIWIARYFNAARLGPGWRSPHVVVQIYPSFEPSIDARENNLVWFRNGYRDGTAQLNFLVTHGFTDAMLEGWRQRLGPPDRTMSCPSPVELRPDGKPSFELWIWDREDARRTLAEIVTHDNHRSSFSPVIGATSMAIDLAWGMNAEPAAGELTGGRRVWRRGVHGAGATLAAVRPMNLPRGRYRLDLELSTAALPGAGQPVAEVVVWVWERGKDIHHFPIAAGTSHAALEFQIDNPGGATSGESTTISLIAGAAESIELSAMTLTLVEPGGVDPFRIFH